LLGRGIMIDRSNRYKEWERISGERRLKYQEDKGKERRRLK
jgi:hypothetical protein